MVQAVGAITNKVYAVGNSRKDVLRTLQQEHPYKSTSPNDRTYEEKVFPEAIILIGG